MIQRFLTVNNTFSYSIRLGIVFSLLVILFSCKSDKEDLLGNWAKANDLSEFEGIARAGAVCATIGNVVYIAGGYDGENRLADIWEYDLSSKFWVEKAKSSAVKPPARSKGIGFAADGKFYFGLGYDRNTKYNDLWAYDPATDKWEKKADFPGTARYGAIAFTIGNIGYVGTGYDDNHLKDFWAYNPSTNTWEQKASLSGSKRRDAVAFVIGNKGYVVTGRGNENVNDFCCYDPSNDTWTSLRKISDATDDSFDDDYISIVRNCGVGFAVGGKGYVATGGSGGSGNTVWEYDPITDLWVEKTAFEGSGRGDAVAFVLNNVPYLALGNSGSRYFDDVWYFEPNAEYYEYDK